jgi:hypothetical protein
MPGEPETSPSETRPVWDPAKIYPLRSTEPEPSPSLGHRLLGEFVMTMNTAKVGGAAAIGGIAGAAEHSLEFGLMISGVALVRFFGKGKGSGGWFGGDGDGGGDGG